MMPPALPEYDRADAVESAIINGLVRTWGHRATVRKPEVDLDELFDPTKADYPEDLIPFHRHDRYLALDENTQNRLRAWAWIAYNKNVMDIEQYVVNPGFGMLSRDEFAVARCANTTPTWPPRHRAGLQRLCASRTRLPLRRRSAVTSR